MKKLGAQIKGELMQNSIRHLIISSTRICLHVFRHLIFILLLQHMETNNDQNCSSFSGQYTKCNKKLTQI